MDQYTPYVLGAYIILCLTVGIYKKENLVYLYATSITFFGLATEVGLQINPEKSVALLSLLIVGISFKRKLFFSKIILYYIIVCITITIIFSISLPEYALRLPPARGTYRGFFQIIVLLVLYLPIFFLSGILNDRRKIHKTLQWYVISCVFMAVLALLQFVIFIRTGSNIFPLSGRDIGSTASVEATFISLMRVNALSGEPKHLALVLIGSLSILILSFFLDYKLTKYPLLKLGLIVIVIFLTFSTQGLALMGLMFIIAPLCTVYFQNKITNRTFKVSIVTIVLLTMLINNPFINEILTSRVVERVKNGDEESYRFKGFEDYDQAVLGYLEDNPESILLGKGMGNIHLYAHPYIVPECRYYMDDQVFYSKKGFLRQLTEVGIIGFILFLAMFLVPLRSIFKKIERTDYLGILICSLSILSLIIYLNTCDGPNFCPFALILLYSYEKILKKEQKRISNET